MLKHRPFWLATVSTLGLSTLALLVGGEAPASGAFRPVPRAAPGAYPYRSATFTQFIADSYREAKPKPARPFYAWFEEAYASSPVRLSGIPRLNDALAARARGVAAAASSVDRVREELRTAVWLYRLVKETIPRFNLARGYEFSSAVRYGERQCLLQSVLIAGLLQAAGVDAGVAMVWSNMRDQESNNGHAVAIVRLSDGRDVEIDASEHRPVATHRGLFVADGRTGRYRFVRPRFDDRGFITGYASAAGRGLGPREVGPLGVGFLRSQFFYYRGEQVAGGLVNGPATPSGLRAAARYLETAVRLDPQNPLAVYTLGRAYLRLGRTAAAKARLAEAYGLYTTFGHLPLGPRTAYDAAKGL